MSHEPECERLVGWGDADVCPNCVNLRNAYKRGRSSIADDIRVAVAPFYDSPHGKYLAPLMSKIRTVLGGFNA